MGGEAGLKGGCRAERVERSGKDKGKKRGGGETRNGKLEKTAECGSWSGGSESERERCSGDRRRLETDGDSARTHTHTSEPARFPVQA